MPKTYTLKSAPTPPTRGQLTGIYWGLWKQIEPLSPTLNRHALTKRTLGRVVVLKDMTDEQLQKMIEVFAAVLRDLQTKQQEVDQPF